MRINLFVAIAALGAGLVMPAGAATPQKPVATAQAGAGNPQNAVEACVTRNTALKAGDPAGIRRSCEKKARR